MPLNEHVYDALWRWLDAGAAARELDLSRVWCDNDLYAAASVPIRDQRTDLRAVRSLAALVDVAGDPVAWQPPDASRHPYAVSAELLQTVIGFIHDRRVCPDGRREPLQRWVPACVALVEHTSTGTQRALAGLAGFDTMRLPQFAADLVTDAVETIPLERVSRTTVNEVANQLTAALAASIPLPQALHTALWDVGAEARPLDDPQLTAHVTEHLHHGADTSPLLWMLAWGRARATAVGARDMRCFAGGQYLLLQRAPAGWPASDEVLHLETDVAEQLAADPQLAETALALWQRTPLGTAGRAFEDAVSVAADLQTLPR